MRLKIPLLLFLTGVPFADVVPASAAWSFRSGETLPGEPTAFDFERKTLSFRDPLSDRETVVPTRNLSLRSRQQLLVSPLFHRGDRDDPLWTPAKRRLLIPALGVPAGIFFLGFWMAAWFFTGRFNPIHALTAFVGSWIVLLIFAVCYTFLELRLGGGIKIILLGIVVATAVTPLFLSAVYNCSYLKALGVLLSHFLAGFCLFSIGLVATDLIAGKKATETWWDRSVFEPVGLIGPDPATPQPAP